jgi:hypothetical protein
VAHTSNVERVAWQTLKANTMEAQSVRKQEVDMTVMEKRRKT